MLAATAGTGMAHPRSAVIRNPPSLAERLRGMVADRLGSAIGLPIVVAEEA